MKKKDANDTTNALKKLLASRSGASEKIIPQTDVTVKHSTPKLTSVYLRENDLEQLKYLRLELQKFSPEGKQPAISELIRTAIHLLPSTEETYSFIMKIKEQDGRKS